MILLSSNKMFQSGSTLVRYKIEKNIPPGSNARWEWWCSKFCTCSFQKDEWWISNHFPARWLDIFSGSPSPWYIPLRNDKYLIMVCYDTLSISIYRYLENIFCFKKGLTPKNSGKVEVMWEWRKCQNESEIETEVRVRFESRTFDSSWRWLVNNKRKEEKWKWKL